MGVIDVKKVDVIDAESSVEDMARITVDINEEWLDAAQQVLGTSTKDDTVNEALRPLVELYWKRRKSLDVFHRLDFDFEGSEKATGRDLSRVIEKAREQLEDGVA